jgi:hypothetical protein
MFFNMDSMIECITYAFNALGFCASGEKNFRNITCEKSLKKISPNDILGRPYYNPPRPDLPEYDVYFPKVRAYWESKKELINTVFEQHDVSKHRETIFVGGKCRIDPPEGFYESLGIDPDDSTQKSIKSIFSPMKEIILMNNPKQPRIDRAPQTLENSVLLEELVSEFKGFVEQTGSLALLDARDNINLKVKKAPQ